ncbi:18833_t:CDS:2 [Gigaspora margarita]|uniref:18833_t:CDS:1 n=1 Tax=Gigaspora margarita TaxID=4874 RepID=A0ABN7U4C3_GIGMA|nr:18833_t:CDS:2 [Gigaspora margarita]
MPVPVNGTTGAYENNACNRHITEPSEKNGSYYNGYFTFPFNANFKLLLMRNSMVFFLNQFNSSSNLLFKAYDSGDDAIQPFGIIHKYGCCLRNRTMNNLRKSLITLPLINYNIQNSHLTTDNDEISIEQLESEINALELFLKDYVINAKQLENLYESIEKSKDQ